MHLYMHLKPNDPMNVPLLVNEDNPVHDLDDKSWFQMKIAEEQRTEDLRIVARANHAEFNLSVGMPVTPSTLAGMVRPPLH